MKKNISEGRLLHQADDDTNQGYDPGRYTGETQYINFVFVQAYTFQLLFITVQVCVLYVYATVKYIFKMKNKE